VNGTEIAELKEQMRKVSTSRVMERSKDRLTKKKDYSYRYFRGKEK
jgi:uncharacterized membrane protein YgaE (UPF0421/DUF939 family)